MSALRMISAFAAALVVTTIVSTASTLAVQPTIESFGDGTRIDLDPGGPIVDLATSRMADGRRTIWLLVDPAPVLPLESGDEDGNDEEELDCPAADAAPDRRIVALTPFDAERAPSAVARTVVEQTAARWIEVVDLDGDGTEELLVGVEDRIERLDPEGGLLTLLVDPALADGPPTLIPHEGHPAWFRLAGIGRDRYLRFDPDAGAPVEIIALANRTGVAAPGGKLIIWSSALGPVPDANGADEAGPLLAGWAPPYSGNRVRVDLVRPTAADEAARRVECWGRLPGDEQQLERLVRMLDGSPVAIVTTIPAGGLNLFGEKLLRIVPLRRDRSRRGVSPLLATETRVNVWQSIEPVLQDVDGDGRTDLVLAYWKGLKDDRVVLDTYRRNTAGGFELRPRSVAFDVKRGDRSFVSFGEDASGDGRPDLVIAGDGRLQLFAGSDNPARLVQRKRRREVPIGEPCEEDAAGVQIGVSTGGGTNVQQLGQGAAPIAVDLDGDGAVEFILRRGACPGPALSIVRFSGATAAAER